MKKIFLICLFLFSSNLIYAQVVKKGNYVKDQNLEKFVGTWQGTTGQDTLTIIFEKHKVYYKGPDVYMDRILGWYKYSKDGVVIDNFLDQRGSSSLEKSILSGATDEENANNLSLNLKDFKRKKILDVTFHLQSGKPDQAILKLRISEGIYLKDEKSKKETSKIPVPSTWKMNRLN